MIKIFNATDTDFSTNGNVVINPVKCLEYKKKSLNGWYIEVEIPIKYIDYIEKDKLCVVKTKSKIKPQAFRIGDTIKKTNKKISFTANHVMFDSEDYFLLDVRPTNMSGAEAIEYINQRTDKRSPFTISSNVENINTEYFVRKNLLEAWKLAEERWNGVFDADNFTIYFQKSVGNDNGESIIYGKNMENMTIFEDWSTVCTKICPVGYDGLLLPEKYLESEVQYEKPYTRKKDFETELDTTEATEEELITELRKKAIDYLNDNKYPKVSYEIQSNINQKMEIGDIIEVKHPLVTIKTEVLEYTHDIILQKIISLTFGNYTRDVKSKFDSIKSSISDVKQLVSKQEVIIKEQTSLINSLNKNGFVYIDENEVLILDQIPKENARNVWRFGLGGIGFSSNGYEGPFKIAITMDGQINADFITTGKLSVNIIEGLAETLDSWSKIMLGMENIKLIVQNTVDITREKEEEASILTLEECMAGTLVELRIYKGSDLTVDEEETHLIINIIPENQEFDLNIGEPLRYIKFATQEGISEVFDEVQYKNGTFYSIRRIGIDESENLYILDNEIVTELSDEKIKIAEGTNTIKITNFQSVKIYAKYTKKNEFTDLFATQVQLNSAIDIVSNAILAKVSQDNIIAAINLAVREKQGIIEITSDLFSLMSKYLTITNEGAVTATNIKAIAGEIAGFKMWTDESGGKTRNWLTKDYEIDGKIYRSGILVRNDYNTDFIFAGMPVASDGSWNTGDASLRIFNNGTVKLKDFYILHDTGENALRFTKYGIYTYLSNGNYWAYKGTTFRNGIESREGIIFHDAQGFEIIDGLHANQVQFYVGYRTGTNSGTNEGIHAYDDFTFHGGVNDNGHTLVTGGERGVGTTIISVLGAAIANGYVVVVSSNGTTVTLSGNLSDRNFKKNIRSTEVKLALEIIRKIRFYSFEWKDGDRTTKIGFIAQELAEIDESLAIKVKQGDNSKYEYLYQLNIDEILAYNTKAIQEIDESFEEYKKENNELKKIVNKQEKVINFLISKLNCEEELNEYLKKEEENETRD